MRFLSGCLVPICQAILFARPEGQGYKALKVSLVALEMLQIGGVINTPWEVELERRLHPLGLELGHAIFFDSLTEDRKLYFKALHKSGKSPTTTVLLQMDEDERNQFRLLDLWQIVVKEPKFTLRSAMIDKLLQLRKHSPEDWVVNVKISAGIQVGLSLRDIFCDLWKNPLPFTNGHLPDGPFACLLRLVIQVPEETLLQGLFRFQYKLELTTQPQDDKAMTLAESDEENEDSNWDYKRENNMNDSEREKSRFYDNN